MHKKGSGRLKENGVENQRWLLNCCTHVTRPDVYRPVGSSVLPSSSVALAKWNAETIWTIISHNMLSAKCLPGQALQILCGVSIVKGVIERGTDLRP